jgi:hypothetical protein
LYVLTRLYVKRAEFLSLPIGRGPEVDQST